MAQERHNTVQREQLLIQQQLQLAETQRGHIQGNVQQLDSRRSRLMLERDNLPQPDIEALEQIAAATRRNADGARRRSNSSWRELQERLPLADAERRKQRDAVQELERQLAQTEARLGALQAIAGATG